MRHVGNLEESHRAQPPGTGRAPPSYRASAGRGRMPRISALNLASLSAAVWALQPPGTYPGGLVCSPGGRAGPGVPVECPAGTPLSPGQIA